MVDKYQNKYEFLLGHIWSSGTKLYNFNPKMSYSIQYYVCHIFAKDEKILPDKYRMKGKQLIMTLKQNFRDLIASGKYSSSKTEYEKMLLSYFNYIRNEENTKGLSMELSEKYRILYDAVIVLELYPGAYTDKMKDFQNKCLKRSEDIKKALQLIASRSNSLTNQNNQMQNSQGQNVQNIPPPQNPENVNQQSYKEPLKKKPSQFIRVGTMKPNYNNEAMNVPENNIRKPATTERSQTSNRLDNRNYTNTKFNNMSLDEEKASINASIIKDSNSLAIEQLMIGNIEQAIYILKKSILKFSGKE